MVCSFYMNQLFTLIPIALLIRIVASVAEALRHHGIVGTLACLVALSTARGREVKLQQHVRALGPASPASKVTLPLPEIVSVCQHYIYVAEHSSWCSVTG